MSNVGLGLGIMAAIGGVIGFMFFRAAGSKATTGNGGGDPGWGGAGDGGHGHHGDGGGGDGGGGGD